MRALCLQMGGAASAQPALFLPCKLDSNKAYEPIMRALCLCLQMWGGGGREPFPPQPPRGLKPCKLVSKNMNRFKAYERLKPIMRALCLQIGGLCPPNPYASPNLLPFFKLCKLCFKAYEF